jgi:hypothetical protein
VKKLIKMSLWNERCIATHLCVFRVCVCVVLLSFLSFFSFFSSVGGVRTRYYSLPIHRSTTRNLVLLRERARALGASYFRESQKYNFSLGGFQSSLHTDTHICPDFRLRIKMYNNWFQPTIRDEFGQKIFGILVVVVVALMRVDRENSPRNGRDTSFFLISWLWLYYKSWNWVRRYIDTCVRPIIFI